MFILLDQIIESICQLVFQCDCSRLLFFKVCVKWFLLLKILLPTLPKGFFFFRHLTPLFFRNRPLEPTHLFRILHCRHVWTISRSPHTGSRGGNRKNLGASPFLLAHPSWALSSPSPHLLPLHSWPRPAGQPASQRWKMRKRTPSMLQQLRELPGQLADAILWDMIGGAVYQCLGRNAIFSFAFIRFWIKKKKKIKKKHFRCKIASELGTGSGFIYQLGSRNAHLESKCMKNFTQALSRTNADCHWLVVMDQRVAWRTKQVFRDWRTDACTLFWIGCIYEAASPAGTLWFFFFFFNGLLALSEPSTSSSVSTSVWTWQNQPVAPSQAVSLFLEQLWYL